MAEVLLRSDFSQLSVTAGRCTHVTKILSKQLERSAFPSRVQELAVPPATLHIVGTLPTAIGVAVVGTRHPTNDAVEYTHALVGELAAAGLAIWSGGAMGIDAAAHRAAMRAGVPTVVVAPAGWSRPYPPEHVSLFEQIVASGGAYLSIVDDECPAKRHQFFARNALLIAMVDSVVVIQAGFRSGARNAAKYARELGRALFVAPSSPWISQGLGCNLELGLGARILGSAREVVRAAKCTGPSDQPQPMPDVASSPCEGAARVSRLGADRASKRSSAGKASTPTADQGVLLEPELRLLLDAVRDGASHVDALCERTGLPLPVVQSDLLRLTLLGLIRTERTGAIDIVNS